MRNRGAAVTTLKILNAIGLSILLVACATTRQVYLPTEGHGIDGVTEGDTVKIVMNDGKKHSFLVTRVDEIGLQSKQKSIAYSDMQSVVVVRNKQQSGDFPWLIIGLTAVGVALAIANAGGDYSSSSGPFCLYSSNDPKRKCL